ncbi:urea transporter [Yinghuangia sp. ASG 101]|uniref:urea transporter n=1 Tax=Yinghuangia sp. ASG 101 TaxID=2896848 RepID=UPI001E455CE2|nr:urea transporter [Yinghuangia sp. ASG 101]UGQ12735.1 urea transporter [Yinghuangia sp. ASG 101]
MPSLTRVLDPGTDQRRKTDPLLASIRGFGQVDLQSNLVTGLAIFAALWVSGWEVGLFATIGTLASTATAVLLGVPRRHVVFGLYGYCGCLTGIALITSLGHHGSTYILTVAAAALCAILTATLTTFFAPYGLTALTAPFCLISGVMVLGAPSFERVWHGGSRTKLSSATKGGTSLSWNDLWHGFFSNVSQIFLVDEWYVGLIMLAGLCVAGWRVGLFAALGSVVGIFTAWALGAPSTLVENGIYGYNAVLVAIAVGAVKLRADLWGAGYALFGAAVSTGLTASITNLFKPFGGHTFTWPFILTTWMLMAAVPRLARPRLPEPAPQSAG